jgi:uncharacterized membrane protein YeaQ/YmgE (transglycosylase-associated protein family)
LFGKNFYFFTIKKRTTMDENTKQWLIYLGIGAVSGWLGSKLIGSDTGILTNIVLGIIGGTVGGYLLGSRLSTLVGGGLIGTILTSAAGAALVLFVYNLITRRSS